MLINKISFSLGMVEVFKVYCGNEGRVISRKFFVFVCSGWLIYSLAVLGLVVIG